jgi:general secretion pathway protein E
MATEARAHSLDLLTLVGWLEADGLVARSDTELVRGLFAKGSFSDKHPLVVMSERNWKAADTGRPLTLDRLTEWLAGRIDMRYVKIDPLNIDVPAVTQTMTHKYARRYQVLPVAVGADSITVGVIDPFDRDWEPEIERMQSRRIDRVLLNPEDLRRYLPEFYTMSKSVQRAEAEGLAGSMQSLEALVDIGGKGELDANDSHIVSIVEWLLQYAYEQRASDIHIEPRRDHGRVRFRIDGVMHDVYQLPANVLSPVVSRIKSLGRMDIAEKRRPQDGRVKTRSKDGDEVELRLSTMPTAFGEKLVMRIFDPTVLLKDFEQLGFSDEDRATWDTMISQPHGVILVTGPTGSGKTTTLYSTLRALAQPQVNVCTVEDPIELLEPSFNQMQVHHAIGLDFAAGVRTLLRQDPDIIMVGEIRDGETANMAVQAALTGHLVLSTLHTNDAPSAVERLEDLGIPRYLINNGVLGVMAQRLVRTLCPHCKAEADLDRAGWHQLVGDTDIPAPAGVSHPIGCMECRNTGYQGRLGIYEILRFTPAVKRCVADGGSATDVGAIAASEGMRRLRFSGALHVAAGRTTIAEVIRVVPSD